jgi:hypothetical protein
MDGKINLAEKLALLDKPYVPGIVGYLNDYKLQIVKVKGRLSGTSTMKPTISSWSSAVVSRSTSEIAT